MDVRIVLLGKTGVGKSATGNTILGTKGFEEEFSPTSVTRQSKTKKSSVSGRDVVVADTPGLFDTSLTNDELKDEIAKCVHLTVPGPHVFLLVLRLGVRYTDEERRAMQWIEENFSKLALKYAMILFTGGDGLEEPVENYIFKSDTLTQLVKDCGGRYHVFNNKNKDLTQVIDLLSKIDKLVEENGGDHYTDQMYKDAQRKIEEEKERLRKEKERKELEEKRKQNPLAIAGKALVTAPAFLTGALWGLGKAIVDVPIGMFNGGVDTVKKDSGRFDVVNVVGGELKGAVNEVAKAPVKVLGGGMEFVESLWKS